MRRLGLLSLLLILGCGRSPSGPSTPASPQPAPALIADYAGYWAGTLTYNACLGLHCSGRIDRTEPYSFRLRQSGNAVRGVFATSAGNVEVSGVVDADASLRLSGSGDTGGVNGAPNSSTFTGTLQRDAVAGLTGSVHFEVRTYLDGTRIDWVRTEIVAPIASATRSDLDAYISNLSGKWSGQFAVRECFDDLGRPFCLSFSKGAIEFVELTIDAVGGTATGELVPVSTRIPVNGRATGRSLTLEGTRDGVAITDFTGSVDDFGRLTGKFSYAITFDGLTRHAEIDLLPLVKLR